MANSSNSTPPDAVPATCRSGMAAKRLADAFGKQRMVVGDEYFNQSGPQVTVTAVPARVLVMFKAAPILSARSSIPTKP